MQDGGPGCQGTVITCAVAEVTASSLDAVVVWDIGHENSYCWGNNQGRYDLRVYI